MEESIVRHIQSVHDPVVLRSFRGHEKITHGVSFDPQMRQLATAGQDGLVYVHSFKPQGRSFKFVGHRGPVLSVAFSPDGSIVASGGDDRTLKLWKNNVYGKCDSIKGHLGSIRSLSFSSDSGIIVSGSDDKTVKGWNVGRHKFMFALPGHTNWVRSAKLAPDNRLVVSGSDDCTVRLWDVENSKELHRFKESTTGVYCVDWISDGTSVCGGTQNGCIDLWDVRSMNNQQINSINVHPTGYYLMSGNEDSSIKIFDLRQGRIGWSLYSHKGPVKNIQFNKAGDYFASCGLDQNVLVWKSNFEEQNVSQNVITFIDNTQHLQGSQVSGVGQAAETGTIAQTKFKANKQYKYPVPEVDDKENNQSSNDKLAEALSSRFEKIVTQMDKITSLIVSLEQRITNNEEETKKLLNNPKAKSLVEQYESIFTDVQHKHAKYYQPEPQQVQQQKINQQYQQSLEEEPVFETGSFMRKELVEDFPEDSDKKLQEEYEAEKRQNLLQEEHQASTNMFQYTQTNPFTQGALANTFNIQPEKTFATRMNLADQLGNLGEWRQQLDELQQSLQEVPPIEQQNVIREAQEGEEEDYNNEQQYQGYEEYEDGEQQDEQGNQGEEEGDNFYQTAELPNPEYLEIHDDYYSEQDNQEQGQQNQDQ